MVNNKLILALQNPKFFKHPVNYFKVIETHVSWILLTGNYAYKIKKPVHYPFVDFSTLQKRKFFYKEELRLNKKLAPSLYLTLMKIENKGKIIEYAIKMKEFRQEALLSALAFQKKLTAFQIEALAKTIALFHQNTPVAKPHSLFANESIIQKNMADNFKHIQQSHIKQPTLLKKLDLIQKWSKATFQKNRSLFKKRKKGAFIRECHGDLHLGNIVLIQNKTVLFDSIEFDPFLRFIDVMNDIAFLTMDLKYNHLDAFSFLLLNNYLAVTGDYGGLALLKFYEIYRAMVRAKIALLNQDNQSLSKFKNYLLLCEKIIHCPKPRLIITHGVSGSGKTAFSKQLAAQLGAIHIRSDMERKRDYGQLNKKELYSKIISEKVYQKLLNLSQDILKSGYSVIVDATFLYEPARRLFEKKAAELNVPFFILDFAFMPKQLKRRVLSRTIQGGSDSEATPDVLEKQLKSYTPLNKKENKYRISINTFKKMNYKQIIKKLS